MQGDDQTMDEAAGRSDIAVATSARGRLKSDRRDALNAQQERYMQARFRRGAIDRRKSRIARGDDRDAPLRRSP
jgi:hypothetical protein